MPYRDHPNNILGVDTSNNLFASTNVAANADGSIIERLEYVQSTQASQILYLPRCVEKSDGSVPATTDDLFTITGGPVRCQIIGLVTTVLGGACSFRLQHTTTAPAATVELNAGAVVCDSDAVGTFYYSLGATSVFTPSGGLGFALLDPVTVEETMFLLAPGTVKLLGTAARTGVIKWYMTYWPLSPNSLVVAAA